MFGEVDFSARSVYGNGRGFIVAVLGKSTHSWALCRWLYRGSYHGFGSGLVYIGGFTSVRLPECQLAKLPATYIMHYCWESMCTDYICYLLSPSRICWPNGKVGLCEKELSYRYDKFACFKINTYIQVTPSQTKVSWQPPDMVLSPSHYQYHRNTSARPIISSPKSHSLKAARPPAQPPLPPYPTPGKKKDRRKPYRTKSPGQEK